LQGFRTEHDTVGPRYLNEHQRARAKPTTKLDAARPARRGQRVAAAAKSLCLRRSAVLFFIHPAQRAHVQEVPLGGSRRSMRRRTRNEWLGVGSTALLSCWSCLAAWSAIARARPEAPRSFCMTYSNASVCLGGVPDCGLCHTSTFPAAWNSYGLAIKGALGKGAFEQALPEALAAVDALDSDLDGVANGVEVSSGTLPGDPGSLPMMRPDAGVEQLTPNPDFAIGRYDVAFAYERASLLYCGHSPSYEDMASFRDGSQTPEGLKASMHERIERCLLGEYWLKEGLVRIADDRIRPIRNLGQDSEVFITIPLPTLLTDEVRLRSVMGDYRYDYRLWVYALSGNRDARDLLLAQYYVEENPDGSWRLTEELIPKADELATAGGQMLEKPYRAGMITTMWFLTRNTMFSDLPRTTAAAAYRAYLGADISKMQGLIPVAGEPDDVDDKGVAAPRCAACHSTLDPLAYAFAPYTGLEFEVFTASFSVLLFGQLEGGLFGIYDPERPAIRMPAWSAAEQQPVLLGKPVQDLRQWAEVAAQSDEFARNLASIFFTHAFAREPEGAELAEFTALWQSVRADGYSANRVIHRLIDSSTFGVP
jgi:Protein of unknown function (DUF1585)